MKRFNEISLHSLREGVYDKNIFKSIFLAGGPGSGKSYVTKRSTGGLGLKVVNSDDMFEKMMNQASLSLKMPPEEEQEKDVIRGKAKKLTVSRHDSYVEGRLGLVIDSTGRDSAKILRHKSQLDELGYDTYMVFVNTSLDVALERNAKRDRSVPESLVVKSWKEVQSNMGLFSNAFRKGFIVVDNNDASEDVLKGVWKRVTGLLRNKVTNTRAKNWIAMELKRKHRP